MALHSTAAGVIAKVLSKKASLKACIYESDWRSKPILTAVVTETLKYKEALEEVSKAVVDPVADSFWCVKVVVIKFKQFFSLLVEGCLFVILPFQFLFQPPVDRSFSNPSKGVQNLLQVGFSLAYSCTALRTFNRPE